MLPAARIHYYYYTVVYGRHRDFVFVCTVTTTFDIRPAGINLTGTEVRKIRARTHTGGARSDVYTIIRGWCNWTWSWHRENDPSGQFMTPLSAARGVGYAYAAAVVCIPLHRKLIYLPGIADIAKNPATRYYLPPRSSPHEHTRRRYYYTNRTFITRLCTFA